MKVYIAYVFIYFFSFLVHMEISNTQAWSSKDEIIFNLIMAIPTSLLVSSILLILIRTIGIL